MTNMIVVEGYITAAGTQMRHAGELPILSFSLSNPVRQGKNDWMNFFNCELIGKYATAMEPHLGPKTRLTVWGQMKQERWEDQSGAKKSTFKVKVDGLSFGGRSEGSEEAPQSKPQKDVAPWETSDDDIPF